MRLRNVTGSKDMIAQSQYVIHEPQEHKGKWSEVFENYQDGLHFGEWYEQNKQWLHELFDKYSIPKDIELFEELYYEFQSEDWRHGSCGGCI